MRKLYDLVLEAFAMPWGQYLQLNKSCGRKVQDLFQYNIYGKISLVLIFVTIISLSFYYLYLNNRFGKYYSNKSWVITLSTNSLIIAVFTYLVSKSILDNPACDASNQLMWISVINLLFSIFLFFLLSFIFRLFSSMGKRTPYLTSN